MPVFRLTHFLLLFNQFQQRFKDNEAILHIISVSITPLELRDVAKGINRNNAKMIEYAVHDI